MDNQPTFKNGNYIIVNDNKLQILKSKNDSKTWNFLGLLNQFCLHYKIFKPNNHMKKILGATYSMILCLSNNLLYLNTLNIKRNVKNEMLIKYGFEVLKINIEIADDFEKSMAMLSRKLEGTYMSTNYYQQRILIQRTKKVFSSNF